jgi:hypothetical protein
MCRAFGQFCSVALLLGIISAAAGAEVAAKAWASALITNDSTDQVSSVTAGGTGKDEFVIIAGDVNAKRGEEIGLQGLVANHHSETNTATNETFADAFVAKVDSATRKLIWVYRYEAGEDYSEKSKYFDVTYSAEKNRVFAVGHKKDKATRTYAPVLTILDGTSGSDISTVIHGVGLNGNAQYTSAAVHGDSVYICGSDTSGKSGGNKNVDADAKVDGGLVFARASAASGKILWSRQAGDSRLRDRCSGVSATGSGTEVFFSATTYPVIDPGTSATKVTGQVAVHAVSASLGDLRWKTAISRGQTVDDTSLGIASDDNSIFVSSSKWTDVYRGKRMFLYKLSASTGTVLFGRETCCGQLLSRLPDGDYQSKGSAEPTRGLYIGKDGFVYQVGAYRARKDSADDGFATVVVRTSIFGQQEAEADISDPIETFMYEAYMPLMLAPSGNGLVSVERYGNLTGSDAEAHNAKVLEMRLQPVDETRQARYRASSGEYYAQFRALLGPVSESATPPTAIAAVIAELTRLHVVQVTATADESKEVTVVTATVYGDRPNVETSPGAQDVMRRMKEVMTGSGASASRLESQMNLRAGVLGLRSGPAVHVSGKTSELEGVASQGGDSGSAAATAAGKDAPASGGSTKSGEGNAESSGKKGGLSKGAIIGIAVGGGIAGIAVIAVIVLTVWHW